MAQVGLEFSAAAAARFLTGHVLPASQAAGWPLQRILPEGHRDGVTDRGNECQGAFDKASTKKGIRHTRARPRHAWTSGFVERLQGIILSELWRNEFRRRLFTGASAMQTALDLYLDFYNHRRSHQGYRTQGRTPGEILCIRGGKRDKRQRHQSVNAHLV